ncbi:MAG: hypothetical protein LM523_01385 [Candidatus Contendobacter sp.]|nr:hypothetical protein [Candidatus Contendobacter sp.]
MPRRSPRSLRGILSKPLVHFSGSTILLAGLLFSTGARAWEEEQAIAFILAWHPVVMAQRTVAASYQPPSLTRRLMEHTAFYVRAASGASSTVSEGGDTTTTSPMTVGIQLNIPPAIPGVLIYKDFFV